MKALTFEQKKKQGWFYEGNGKYYFRTCDNCRKEYIGQGLKYCSYRCNRLANPIILKGKDNKAWRGGVTNYTKKIRKSNSYITWREAIFKRDNYTCQKCQQIGGKLCVDHYQKGFARILFENNINSLEDAILCNDLWDLNNGRVLCISCHKNTDNYMVKAKIEINNLRKTQ